MDSVLLALWRQGFEASQLERIEDEASVAVARTRVRAAAQAAGLDKVTMETAALVASELGHNVHQHGQGGHLGVRRLDRDGQAGLELVAIDSGPGLKDPALAMRGSGVSETGLGVGLAGLRRLSHELDIDVRTREGLGIRARIFPKGARPVRSRREVGILGIPEPREARSGDHAGFIRWDDCLDVWAIDGVGHGPEAREISDRVTELLLAGRYDRLETALLEIHEACQRTRGAVIALARIEEPSGRLQFTGLGNVAASIHAPRREVRRLRGRAGFAGNPGLSLDPSRLVREAVLKPADMLILVSDGLTRDAAGGLTIGASRGEHPVVVGASLTDAHRRGYDDSIVVVVR